ncbi:MAG: 50S ribosomal protein L21e [Candidatus Micrarchaeota archaeon]|nr:50S ribosomal protein L21e [Candidatus Micrarchaeota archaeon]
MKRSKGKMSKRTRKVGNNALKLTASVLVKKYEIGQKVAIVPHPRYPAGMPHPKYKGRVGKIIGKKGKAYEIEIKDGEKNKIIIANCEHIKEV